MSQPKKPLILCVDDDERICKLEKRFLENGGYDVITAGGGREALRLLEEHEPDLILLDVMMPEMNGWQLCALLQQKEKTAYIPVLFVTALGEKQNKTRALAAGGVDYLVKPFAKDALLQKVRRHMEKARRWKKASLQEARGGGPRKPLHQLPDLAGFKGFLKTRLGLSPEKKGKLFNINASHIYSVAPAIGITAIQMAELMAEFLGLEYLSFVDPDEIDLGVLPTPYCRANLVVAVSGGDGPATFLLSNPFDLEVLDYLSKVAGQNTPFRLRIAAPDTIRLLFKDEGEPEDSAPAEEPANEEGRRILDVAAKQAVASISEADLRRHPVLHIGNTIIESAVAERCSDVHIEPKEGNTLVRFRVDGEMRDMFVLKKNLGVMLISRLKVLAGMDITEKRKPQDGVIETVVDGRTFRLRLASTSTPNGESLIIRLLEPYAKPKSLGELGMSPEQVATMMDLTKRSQGLILVVGPTGSGKTTTIYSLLGQIDCKTRSLISVEDPVEYLIPFANQQQVNEKAGVTFESLLRSSVRQDPDILFLGEMRDPGSARIAMDFASTGHLTLATLHSSNATTAIFRLERLGIDRGTMADSILCIVAQRLVKRLCQHCMEIAATSQRVQEMLAPFTDGIPAQVAYPSGCPKCNHTGYHGREGIFELLAFDRRISEEIRKGTPIADIRRVVSQRGDFLIGHHAVQKVRELVMSPEDVWEEALEREAKPSSGAPGGPGPEGSAIVPEPGGAGSGPGRSILVVEDDKKARLLIHHVLKKKGYDVTLAKDGIDALLCLGRKRFDLIITDINMPDLDGFELVRTIHRKGINTPVIFLTGRGDEADEIKGFEMGAADYIKKPVKREILEIRVNNVLCR